MAQKTERTDMDPSERIPGNEDDVGGREAGFCHFCQPRVGLCVAAVAVVCVGLLLALVLFGAWTAAPDVCPTPSSSERVHQCQKQNQDLNLMLHTISQDSRCRVCPDGWIWWRRHCYFFSEGLLEDRRWNESREFCVEHNSSLAVIKDAAEMDFIQSVMRRFPRLPFLWVGLTDFTQEGQWLWTDGMDIQHYKPGLIVQWDSDHRDCADLRGSGTFFAAECEAHGPWLCKGDS